MLKIFTLVLFILGVISAPVSAQTNNPPEWEWNSKVTGIASGSGIIVDSKGNTYTAGSFNKSVTIGNTTLTSDKPHGEGYVAKYDAAGKEVWVIKLGGDARKLVMDSQENIFVTGGFEDTGVFGSTVLKSNGIHDYYLVKLNSAGQVLWATNTTALSGNEASATGVDVGIDAKGNIYVTGIFIGDITFGNVSLASQGRDLFILKLDPFGKAIWARKAGGDGFDSVGSIAVDATGNSFITGDIRGTAHFGAISISSEYSLSISGFHPALFIAKYNTAGDVVWVKKTGSSGTHSLKITLDKNGFIFLTGWFSGPANFASTILYAYNQSMFLAKYDAAGDVIWAREAGGYWYDSGLDVAIDRDGNSYVTGFYTRQATFGNFTIENEIGSSFYAAKYNSEGKVLWVKQFGSPKAGGRGNAIAVDALGNCYITGGGNETAFEGIDQYEDRSDKFVAKLASDADPAILTSNLPELEYCAGAIVPVSFLKSGSYAAGNTFTAQLSDASGSFANPVTIGTGQSAPIMAELPAGIAPGAGYRIRVVAGVPAVIGMESSIPVSIVARPMAPVVIPAASCGSGNVTLAVSGARTGEAYHWYATATGGEVLAIGPTFNTPAINSTTHYYVSLVNGTGCESNRTLVTATIDPALNVQAGSDAELCIGGGDVQLTGFSPAGGTWSGTGVSKAGVFSPSLAGAGTHTLTYTFDNGHCAGYSTKVMQVTPIPAIQAGFEPVECGTAESPSGLAPLQVKFTNSTSGATAYLWEFGDGTTSQEAAPGHTYNTIGNYDVYLTTFYGNNCSNRQQVTTVQVERRKENANVFTPNGDGLNDYFVLNVSCLPLDLKVFDRWGKLVFEQADYRQNWDGGNQRSGIYFYHATTSNGQNWKGWVEMIR
ncbi:SBBP repeat-containing protein [Pontibacter lucknowensis]|uniref:Gliding motility-associated C-terminal domain-containing protein n=1 Tax=Pontibacter lucknowensis TaxID=1077936 RepID=A0A1N6ZH79_9BACT|nr:SBBP repeat-containing protein [Pontibacter lucknowensis]SIR26173.1 gliding motility-associated C-terminal domain-containing protein [Pontibacter lucknowensis]